MAEYLGGFGLGALVASGVLLIWSVPLYRAPHALRLRLARRHEAVALSAEQVRRYSRWSSIAGGVGIAASLALVAVCALSLR